MSELKINRDLIDRVREARELEFNRDIAAESDQEEWALMEVARKTRGLTDSEKAMCIFTILEDNPLLFYQVLFEAWEYKSRRKRKGKNNENSNNLQ